MLVLIKYHKVLNFRGFNRCQITKQCAYSIIYNNSWIGMLKCLFPDHRFKKHNDTAVSVNP